MNNLDKVKNYLINTLNQQYDKTFSYDGLTHSISVASFAGMMALKYDAPTDLCMIAGYLHDIAFYTTHYHSNHAKRSSEMAKEILLKETDLTEEDIQRIVHMIANHSNKGFEDDLCSEILKNADVMSHALENGENNLNEIEKAKFKKMMEK